MSKFLKLLLITMVSLGFLSTSALADASKGQKLFIKELKPACGFDGGSMAKKHKQAEWKAIQEGGKLNDEIKKFCPEAKPLKDTYVEHIYDFLYNYASDSGNVPSC